MHNFKTALKSICILRYFKILEKETLPSGHVSLEKNIVTDIFVTVFSHQTRRTLPLSVFSSLLIFHGVILRWNMTDVKGSLF